MAYLTQAEAGVYSATIAAMPAAKADGLLQAASDMTDAFCGRTFDTVIEPLPEPVKLAISYWAEELSKGTSAGRDVTNEKIGDYSISYSTASSSTSYAPPSIVATLLSPYRIIVVG